MVRGAPTVEDESEKTGGRRTAKPTSVSSINVHDDVWQVQSLDGIRNSSTVASGGILACREIGVGDKVRQ